MFNRAETRGQALSLLIVLAMAIGGALAASLVVAPPARAATCDQPSSAISGNWIITTAQSCSGIVYTIDGNVYIQSPGSLTLTNGGLIFSQDSTHVRGLFVNVSTSLTLVNSYVTTQTVQLNPYLKLAVTVAGTVNLRSGSYFKFPGTVAFSTGAALNMTSSRITGFSDAELSPINNNNAWLDDNDDSANLTFTGATAYLYQSRIEKIYERALTQNSPAANVVLASGSRVYAFDSFLALDFSPTSYIHNAMTVDTTSSAYLYNLSMDIAETAGIPISQWSTAFVVSGSGNVYLLRWARITVTDQTGVAVPGASIASAISPGTQAAQYPDNGLATTPTSTARWYMAQVLGLTNSPYATTDGHGQALIPLWTDQLTSGSAPNANSFGNYQLTATFSTYTPAVGGVSYAPYPNMTAPNGRKNVTLQFTSSVICTSGVTVWSGTKALTGPVSVGGTLEIAGSTTVTDGAIYIDQQANACAYIKIDSGATLTFVNSMASSNYPLVIDVLDGGHLAATRGSMLALTQQGMPGLLRSDGTTSTVTVRDSAVWGNVSLAGSQATFVGATLYGPSLSIATASPTDLWDTVLPGVTNVSLGTDLGSTWAFDIRNVTFNQVQTQQLVFRGTQHVELTNVQLYDPTDTWYLTMITQNAVVARYWWLTIGDVDGTGTLLADANATIALSVIDPNTLAIVPATNPVPGDTVYGTTSTTWPVNAPTGSIVYRAFDEQRTANAANRVVNNSYVASGTAAPQGTTYTADSSVQATVNQDTYLVLTFTTLTPDLSVTFLQVSGPNGNDLSQPLNRDLNLTATIHNTGQINVRSVKVNFYSTNVDANSDGLMDLPPSMFAGYQIGDTVTIPLVPRGGDAFASVLWDALGGAPTSPTLSIVVDPPLTSPGDGGAIRETNELNNILTQTVNLFPWPDLYVSSADIVPQSSPVVLNNVPIRVTVHNLGTAPAQSATLQLFENGRPVSALVTYNVLLGDEASLILIWRPATIGVHVLTLFANTANNTNQNRDYNMTNNVANLSLAVHTQPDLALVSGDYQASYQEPQGESFPFIVHVHNYGETSVEGSTATSVAIYLDGNLSARIGYATNVTVLANSETNVTITVNPIDTAQTHTLLLVVDPNNALIEGNESNNRVTVTVIVTPPAGNVFIGSPDSDKVFQPSDTIHVTGYVRDQNSDGIPGVTVKVSLLSSANVEVTNATAVTEDTGFFQLDLPLAGASDGSYTIRASTSSSDIRGQDVSIIVRANVPFFLQPVPLIGLPWWMFLVILAAVAAAIIGVTLYFKVFGLGKMVECGECGAFIPEDATVCPKCGVEFEKDMAKCSNCQAWIPVDVKQCPECGVEFATGQVEMADYQEKMRLQYDEVVQKFKEDASRQLGRSLSDKEFQEWWRKQPTFVTFEDWLREEEEMRKMGSKPCPVCGTLNSVTATVCHKCGSLMKQETRPPSGGAVGGAPAKKPASPAPAAAPPPQGGAQAPPAAPGAEGLESIPRRVIRRPIATPQPVVQKKVIKKPVTEGQQGESAEGGDQSATGEKEEDL